MRRKNISMIEHEIKKISQAAEMIKGRVPEAVDILMILGTGLGGFVDQVEFDHALNYKDIPSFPVSLSLIHI